MAKRTCGWCGTSIDHMQPRAKYCCRQHKKNAGSKRHRERNPGYYRRYNGSPARVAWKAANQERIRAYAREQQAAYRAEHPDAASAWWAANANKHRMYQSRRRAAEKLLVTDRDIRRLLTRHRHCCAYCGRSDVPLQIDHVVPLKLGGRHSIGNLLPACGPCNGSKSATLLSAWLRRIRTAA